MIIKTGLSRKYHHSSRICLCYHEVRDKEYQYLPRSSIVMTEKDFERHIRFVSRYLKVMHPDEFLARMRENSLPPRACIITFDDGFASTLHNAYPILQRYNMPFMVFISTGYIRNRRPWDSHILEALIHSAQFQGKKIVKFDGIRIGLDYNSSSKIRKTKAHLFQIFQDKIPYSKRESFLEFVGATLDAKKSSDYPRMLTEDEVRHLSSEGVVIGAHTEWHISIGSDGPENYYKQMYQSKITLEEITGKKVLHFAYPYGREKHCTNAAEFVQQCGFQYAFTAFNKPAHFNQMPYLINRIGASRGVLSLVMGLFECKPSQIKERLWKKRIV